MGLIAKTTIVALVDGTRKEYASGTDVTGILSEHDVTALIELNAIEDTEKTQAVHRRQTKEAAEASLEFQRAREKVQAQQAALAPMVSSDAGSNAGPTNATQPEKQGG